jgi:hypothetical protein
VSLRHFCRAVSGVTLPAPDIMRWAMALSSAETEPFPLLAEVDFVWPAVPAEAPADCWAIAGAGASNAIANRIRPLLDN